MQPLTACIALQAFGLALAGVAGSATLVDSQSEPGREYRRWAVGGVFGQDYVEVLLRSSDREGEETLATVRFMAGAVTYVYPVSLPLSDGGAQRKRAAAVRQKLGWRIFGCSEIACYLGV